MIRYLFTSLTLILTLASFPLLAADERLSFKRGSVTSLPFGGAINEVFVLDVFDVDDDGTDDLAVSGKVKNGKQSPVHTFIIRNNTDTGKPQVIDLGEAGLTRSTWSGKFYRETNGQVYFVHGRNGEGFGMEYAERASIFRVTPADGTFAVEAVYELQSPHFTASVERCDIDGDATAEIYINNYGHPDGDEFNAPQIVQMKNGQFVETDVTRWYAATGRHGANNSITFADIDGDGDCDLLSAMEAAKWQTSALTFPGEVGAFAVLNANGKLDGNAIAVPNPHFGDDNGAFSFEMLNQGSDRLFFVHSSAYEGPNGQNFHDNFLQAYRYLDGAFVEVTDEVIDKQFAMWSANQRWVRFEDIDRDGDSDLYFSGYTGDIAIYRNLGGKFRREIVLKDPGGGSMGVAFLSNPTTKCSDLVIARRDGKLSRYVCHLQD
ncbi:MAG: hypothetical protein HY834_18240 [Devosia nanyangense]|uniref:VCBS repeat-containing protein n=1 Tax=Devosia nanyangense TaxID=1228055 RepID=A0A933L4B0_9HYPH|nr:hypothetical protein [Devosia nanyangense]